MTGTVGEWGDDEPKRNPISGELTWPCRGTWPLSRDPEDFVPTHVYYCTEEGCELTRYHAVREWGWSAARLNKVEENKDACFATLCPEHMPDLSPFED